MKLFCIKCQKPITQVEYTQGAMYCNSCRKDIIKEEEQAREFWNRLHFPYNQLNP